MFGNLWRDSNNQNGLEDSVPEIMSCPMFREELEREMLRSDRNDTPLTLLIFSIYNMSGRLIQDDNQLTRLARSLNQVTRRTDIKGWLRNQQGIHVALMLHNTAYENAERILACVRERFVLYLPEEKSPNLPEPHVDCEIYAYPVSSSPGEDRFEQLRLFDDESLLAIQTGEQLQDRGKDGSHGVRSAPADNTASARPVAPIRSMEELLAIPVPWWKRGMDIAVSFTALLILSPLFLTIALLVKLSSPGGIIFKQQRVGHLGKPFSLWKFRSMRANADPAEHKKYLSQLINGNGKDVEKPMRKLDAGDPQITSIGRFLRVTCLDELPQLVNVLRGDMSLVGPRPCLPYEAKEYLLWHNRRFDTIPGITGLWQVSGKNKTTFRQMIRLDIQYTTHRSFWLDIKIILKTLPAVMAQIRDEMGASKSAREPIMQMDRVR